MFDAQCKRIHEYKRQHLNLLHVIALWDRIRRGIDDGATRTVLLAGKAAPAYHTAKLIIRLAHGIAEAIAEDPRTRDRLRLVFVPDFNVKTAQRIYPAADLSEQISTAGMEASGTGNMKFTLNGALTIGTLDGANVEIRECVGAEHFFLFGLTTEQVAERKRTGYRPYVYLAEDQELARALDLITSGAFSPGDRNLFSPLRRQPRAPRSVPGARGLPLVHRHPARRRARVAVAGGVGEVVDPQQRTRRDVLVGPFDRGVREEHLARPAREAPDALKG
jgi:starch phosphorylase